MRIVFHLVTIVALFLAHGGRLHAQDKKPVPPTAAQVETKKSEPIKPVSTTTGMSYPFPAEDRAKIRDLQYQYDQLAITNQKMQLEIDSLTLKYAPELEKNRLKLNDLWTQLLQVAKDVADKNKIDLTKYNLDLVEVRFKETQEKPAK